MGRGRAKIDGRFPGGKEVDSHPSPGVCPRRAARA
jgi:hypothetical protein